MATATRRRGRPPRPTSQKVANELEAHARYLEREARGLNQQARQLRLIALGLRGRREGSES